MKIIKIIVLISLVQVPFIFSNYVKDKYLANYIMVQKIYNKALSTAMHDATTIINKYSTIELVEGTPEIVIDPKTVVNTFLESFCVQITGSMNSKEIIDQVPFVAIADVDGVYFYEVIEVNHHYESKYYNKEKYTRDYIGNTVIQFYLNDHIRVFNNGLMIYEGYYYDGDYTMPEKMEYETEKLYAVSQRIESRIESYVKQGKSHEVSIPVLSKDDWDRAATDISIIALIFEERGQTFRLVNNCGITNVRQE